MLRKSLLEDGTDEHGFPCTLLAPWLSLLLTFGPAIAAFTIILAHG